MAFTPILNINSIFLFYRNLLRTTDNGIYVQFVDAETPQHMIRANCYFAVRPFLAKADIRETNQIPKWIMGIEPHPSLEKFNGILRPPGIIQGISHIKIASGIIGVKSKGPLHFRNRLLIIWNAPFIFLSSLVDLKR